MSSSERPAQSERPAECERDGCAACAVCLDCGCGLCAACRVEWEGARCASCVRARLRPVSRRRPPVPTAVAMGVGLVLGALGLGLGVERARAEAVERANQRALERVGYALDDFFLDQTRYPTEGEGLRALVSADPQGTGTRLVRWRGPYLAERGRPIRYDWSRRAVLDAYGTALLYAAADPGAPPRGRARGVYVASAGPDRRFTTPGIGVAGFGGAAEGDDALLWVAATGDGER